MTATRTSSSAAIRARLRHPVVDVDGHMVELVPVVLDYMREEGGASLAKTTAPFLDARRVVGGSLEERKRAWSPIGNWWGYPSEITLDRATSYLPRLLHRRMDEMGLDFTILYPSFGLSMPRIPDEGIRRAACSAYNRYLADTYREYGDRMTPAAVIPMHTPTEAISELDHAVLELGLKVVIIGPVARPMPVDHRERAGVDTWIDLLALDSPYDYDPFWVRCAELKVSPTSHAVSIGWGARRSPSNYMFNHCGQFADAGQAMCKAIFLGGVTRRFPTLNFAFLEGGAGWAANLYADMLARWKKRNGRAIQHLNPELLDQTELMSIIHEYGDHRVQSRQDEIRAFVGRPEPAPEELDDWAACMIGRPEDLRDLFVQRFYFGCEADDPTNTWAFDTKVNPMGAQLRAVFGSDIGHWDVTDMRNVLEEAFEPVEHGLITPTAFRDLVFTNPLRLHGGANPDFFKGTILEHDAKNTLDRMSD